MNNDNGQENPFVYGKMIKEPGKFWGRNNEFHRLSARLHNIESTSIVGPRRIGKSSLAYFIYSTAQQDYNDSFRFVWLDAQSNHARSLQDFCIAVTSKSAIDFVPTDNPRECLKNFEDAVVNCEKTLVIIINEFELLTDENHKTEFDISFFHTLIDKVVRSRTI
jgi:hypothetical protein